MRNRNTSLIGKVLLEFDTLTSTNAYAQALLAEGGIEEGTVISAEYQTRGVGQAGTSWEGEPRQNLLLSVILYPTFLEASAHFLLNQTVALAVSDLLCAHSSHPVAIKWPNDVYLCQGKAAGILLQTSLRGSYFQHAVVGIGINVNQTYFAAHLPNPVSLALCEGKTFDLASLCRELCLWLDARYQQLREGQVERIQKDYLQRLYRLHTRSGFVRPDGQCFEGVITGVATDGRLKIRHDNGAEELFALKEIIYKT